MRAQRVWVLPLLALLAGAAPSPQAVEELERGKRLMGNGDAVGAEASFKAALALSPDYAAALNEIGVIRFKAGQLDEAIGLFQKACASDAKFAKAFYNLGYANRKASHFPEAAVAYRRYTELSPDDPDGFYGLGESLRATNEKRNALAAYEQYLAREKRPSEQKWIDKARGLVETLKKELPPEPPVAAASAAPTEAPARASPIAAPAPAGAASAPQVPAPVAPNPAAHLPSAVAPASSAVASATSFPAVAPAAAPSSAPVAISGAVSAQAPSAPPALGRAGVAGVAGVAGASVNVTPPAVAGPKGAPAAAAAPSPRVAKAREKLVEGDRLFLAHDAKGALFAYQDAADLEPDNADALFKVGVAYAGLTYLPQAIQRWEKVEAMPTATESLKAAARTNIQRARAKLAGEPGAPSVAAGAAPAPAPAMPPSSLRPAPSASAPGAPAGVPSIPPSSLLAAPVVAAPSQGSVPPPSLLPSPAPAPNPEVMRRASSLYSAAVSHMNDQKYVEAVRELTEALDSKPDFAYAFVARGNCYIGLGRYAESVSDFEKALRLDARLVQPLFGMGEALRALGRRSEASAYYLKYASAQGPDVSPELQAEARRKAANP